MAMSAYFDGSETFGAGGLLKLAGIAASDKAWIEAEDIWREMLRSLYPVVLTRTLMPSW